MPQDSLLYEIPLKPRTHDDLAFIHKLKSSSIYTALQLLLRAKRH